MTKKIILTFFLVTLTLLTYGQSNFGIKAGMNATKLTSSQSKAQFGFLGGVTLDTPISDNFSFYPGVLFSFNRFKSPDNKKPYYSLKSYSLEIPILLSFKFGETPVQLAFDFGPYIRYGLYGKTYANNQKTNTFDDLKRFDIGGQIGLRSLMNNIQIGFNFQYGFIKPSDLYRGNNYTFNMMLGYNFEL